MLKPGSVLLCPETVRLVLLARWTIARAGEADGLGWWRSDALTDAGQFALGKLTPRASGRAGARAAVEAARLRHSGMLGQTPCWHLFDLGAAAELALRVDHAIPGDLWGKWGEVLRTPFAERTDLLTFLVEAVGVEQQQLRDAAGLDASDGRVEVIALSEAELVDDAALVDAVTNLAAAYSISRQGHVTAPYVRHSS